MEEPEVIAERPGLHVTLLADTEELGVVEVRSSPGEVAPPVHVHRRHSESFYVLRGELTFSVDGEEVRAGPGNWVRVPPDTPHTFAVSAAGESRFLDLHAPSCGFGDFVRALHNARDEDELAAARAQFDQELAP
jgi:quercetin dioxygenase-like cupin family protein